MPRQVTPLYLSIKIKKTSTKKGIEVAEKVGKLYHCFIPYTCTGTCYVDMCCGCMCVALKYIFIDAKLRYNPKRESSQAVFIDNLLSDAELGLEGYVMFRKDRMGIRGGGVLLYVKDTIPAYEIQLREEADCEEAIWCKLVTGHKTVTMGVVYRCPNITKESNEKIQNAIREVSKGDCIVMGDFNHGNIQWDTLESTGVEDQQFMCLIQDNFLIQHVLEPTRGGRVLDLVLSSQKEFVDNVNIQEPLGSSDHNQVHFNIKIKSDKTKVSRCKRNFRKGNYKEMRTILEHIDWNDKMKNKTGAESWNILKK